MATQEDKSVLIVLFNAIRDKIKAEVSQISEVYIWNEQSENEPRERPFAYPYVGVEFNVVWQGVEAASREGDLQRLIQEQQKGVCTIALNIVYEELETETESFEDTETTRHQVHRAVNLMSGDQFSPLMRTGSDMPPHDRVIRRTLTYSSELTEAIYLTDKGQDKIIEAEFEPDFCMSNKIIRTGVE